MKARDSESTGAGSGQTRPSRSSGLGQDTGPELRASVQAAVP